MPIKQLSKKEAIAFYYSGKWKKWTDKEIIKFQIYQEFISVPFLRFHNAIENVLGRSVGILEILKLLNGIKPKKRF